MKNRKALISQDINKLKQEVLRDIDRLPHDLVLPKLEILYNNDPKDIMVLNALAHIYYNKRAYAKAMQYVLNVLIESPNDVQALKYKAWVSNETGGEKQCKDILWQIFKAGNADWEVVDHLAEMNEQDGQYLAALGFYTLALKEPDNLQPVHAAIGGANCYCNAGAFGIADEIYDTLLDVYPGDGLILHNKANNFYLKGELDKAEKILLEIIAKDPQFEISKLLLVDIKFKRAALTSLQNAKEDILGKELKSSENISINKNDEDSNLNLFDSPEELDALLHEVRDLQEKGDYVGAKNILATIIKVDDSIEVAWLYLAHLHYQLLELPESIECCDKFLLLIDDMNDSIIVGCLDIKAKSLFALGKLEEALTICEKIISMEPTNYMLVLLKARILNRKGDYTGALNILLPVMSIIPPETELAGFANYLLATAYYKLGNEAEFIKTLKESLRLGCEFGTRWFRTKYATTEDTYKGTTVTKVYERKDLK